MIEVIFDYKREFRIVEWWDFERQSSQWIG